MPECLREGYRTAYQPYVAAPALLYIDDAVEGGLIATAGGGRMLGAVGLVLAVAIGVTVLAGRRLVRPIRDLTGAAQRMEAGERDARVEVNGRDDVARLGAAFNSMATSLEHTEAQRRAMVSDIAHELRTPLTTLRGYLEAAQDGVVAIDAAFIASLLDESVLVQRLVDDLQQLALADAGQLHVHPEPLDAVELATQVATAHGARAAAAGVALSVEAPSPVAVEADPARLRQALGNLVANALHYTPAGGHICIRVDSRNTMVALSVTDTGEGIPAEHLPRIFERFYRADPSRSRDTGGSGLGLAITRSLIEAHGGHVAVQSTLAEGSNFTIHLPRVSPVSPHR